MDPLSSALRIVAQRGFPQWWVDFWNNEASGQGSCGVAQQRAKRIIVGNVEKSPIFRGTPYLEVQLKVGVRSLQSTPLLSRSGRVIGMLSTHYKRARRPDNHTLSLLDLLGREAADCIEYMQQSIALRESEQHLRGLSAQLAERTHSLQESEERIAAILEGSSEAIVAIDRTGKIIAFNRSATRLFGYSAEEAVGQHVRILLPPGERKSHEASLRRYAKTHEPHIIGKTRALSACHKDGTLFPMELTVTEVDHLNIFVGCMRDMTAARALQQEVLHIAMLERQRIGQELHDGTQQELTGLGLLALNLKEKLSQQGAKDDAELATRIATGIAQANLNVRHLAHGLIPVPIDADNLTGALALLAQNTQQIYGLSCRFECLAPVELPDLDTATHLYRIAQEAVANSVKHAMADALSIRLARTNGELTLEITDNGNGIDLNNHPLKGIGLRLMAYRSAVIGAKFDVRSREGRGTTVRCVLPSSVA